MIIYKTTNLINDKIYIGQDSFNDPNYLGSGFLILKAIKKYGVMNFKKEIIEQCSSIEHMNEREIYWISYYNSIDKNIGYNIATGGKKGPNCTLNGFIERWGFIVGKEKYEQHCNKTKENHKGTKGYKWSEETRLKISLGNKGKKVTEETKKRQSESAKGRKRSEESKKKQGKTIKGHKTSEETRRKISESNKGKKMSLESRLKLSLSTKGRIPWNKGLTKETDERMMKLSINTSIGHKGQVAWNKGMKRKLINE